MITLDAWTCPRCRLIARADRYPAAQAKTALRMVRDTHLCPRRPRP